MAVTAATNCSGSVSLIKPDRGFGFIQRTARGLNYLTALRCTDGLVLDITCRAACRVRCCRERRQKPSRERATGGDRPCKTLNATWSTHFPTAARAVTDRLSEARSTIPGSSLFVSRLSWAAPPLHSPDAAHRYRFHRGSASPQFPPGSRLTPGERIVESEFVEPLTENRKGHDASLILRDLADVEFSLAKIKRLLARRGRIRKDSRVVASHLTAPASSRLSSRSNMMATTIKAVAYYRMSTDRQEASIGDPHGSRV